MNTQLKARAAVVRRHHRRLLLWLLAGALLFVAGAVALGAYVGSQLGDALSHVIVVTSTHR
ncbi:hypothetical protein [Streptomyces sp. 135]|uniref:hypothetical protein n=1 Tax=Streptomyces sp. 135 TaxID=2838850 RepID=UPI001CBC9AE3|nr:hypothetical protein [Streptomyces sp. 135]